jgi:hypothetical protein
MQGIRWEREGSLVPVSRRGSTPDRLKAELRTGELDGLRGPLVTHEVGFLFA